MSKEPGFLNKKAEKWLKALHITFAASCVGCLFSMIILIVLKNNLSYEQNLFQIDLAIYHLANDVLNYAFYGLLVTTFIYSLFTRWGFFKYYWIILKWIGVVAAFAIVWFWFGPAINGSVALTDAGLQLTSARDEYLLYGVKSKIFIFMVV